MISDINISYDKLLQDGFSSKFAQYYLDEIQTDSRSPDYDGAYGEWAHSHGFLASDTYVLDLENNTLSDFMSRYEYYKIWPSNRWSRIWIDDKLTLKYMLQGTEFSHVMPEYYFYSNEKGLCSLMDNPYPGCQDMDTFLKVVREKGSIACKPNNGSLSVGFFKISYEHGCYYLNDKKTNEHTLTELVSSCPNYVFTEFFYPCKKLEKIHPKIQTLRVVVLNTNGNNPLIVSKHFRFGQDGAEPSNFKIGHSSDDYNIFACADLDSGRVDRAFKLYFNRKEQCAEHPDTNQPIDVVLPELKEVKKIALAMAKYFSNLEWLGYDFCVTPDGVKLMEINSHPDLRMIQVMQPLYKIPAVKEWAEKRLKEKNTVKK